MSEVSGESTTRSTAYDPEVHGGIEVVGPSRASSSPQLGFRANNSWEAYSLLSPNHTVRTDGSEEAQERASQIEERTWTPVPDCYGTTTPKAPEGGITNGPYVRRHFGTTRRLVIFCACVSLFIIVGAVLGGVLGTLLATKKRS